METEELKKLQAPLKEKYRADPRSAIVTLRVKGRIGEGISCKVETDRTEVVAGLHPATGGDGTFACSGDLLLESLAGCAGVTLSAVATAMGITIKDGIVTAEGELDFRGTLGVSKEAPVGFKEIRLAFELHCNEPEEKLKTLLRLTERFCVVYQTLIAATEIKTKIRVN